MLDAATALARIEERFFGSSLAATDATDARRRIGRVGVAREAGFPNGPRMGAASMSSQAMASKSVGHVSDVQELYRTQGQSRVRLG